jgi:hypothetical protein
MMLTLTRDEAATWTMSAVGAAGFGYLAFHQPLAPVYVRNALRGSRPTRRAGCVEPQVIRHSER